MNLLFAKGKGLLEEEPKASWFMLKMDGNLKKNNDFYTSNSYIYIYNLYYTYKFVIWI